MPKQSKPAVEAIDRLYTWEEVSWMTGLSIQDLLELFGQDQAKGAAYESLPPRIDQRLLDELAENEFKMHRNVA